MTVAALLVIRTIVVAPKGGLAAGASQHALRPVQPPKDPVSIEGLPTEGKFAAHTAIIEYSDFQCPFCGQFARETLPQLRERYIKTGKLLLVYRHMPLSSIHPYAAKAADAAECARQQGRFWQMHDALFTAQKNLDVAHITSLADAIGLDQKQFSSCLGAEPNATVSSDLASARSVGVTGTPAFLIGTLTSNKLVRVSEVLTGMQTYERLSTALETPSLVGAAR